MTGTPPCCWAPRILSVLRIVAAEFPQLVGDEARGAVHVVLQLGMRVEIVPPRGDLVGEAGDAVDDGHGS